MDLPIYVTPLVLGILLFFLIQNVVRAPGRAMRDRFRMFGTVQGRTKAEILTAVGPPTARSALQDGRTLLQWQATGYHIALRFGPDDICEGVTHEASVT